MRFRASALLIFLTVMGLIWQGRPVSAGRSLEPAKIRRAIVLSQFGEDHLRRGELERAGKLFVRALDLVPELPSAHLGMGHVAMKQSRFEAALRQYRAAREGWIQINRYLTRARESAAAAVLGKAMTRRSLFPDVTKQAAAGGGGGMKGDVLESFALEPETDPIFLLDAPEAENPTPVVPGEFYFYIGNALFMLRRTEAAIEAWESCAELSPDFGEVYANMAIAYYEQGDRERAQWCLDQAREHGQTAAPDLETLVGGQEP